MIKSKLQTSRQFVHDLRQALDDQALRIEFEVQRGIFPERYKLRQHPRSINLNRFSQISDSEKRLGRKPVNVRLVFGILRLQVSLQQSLFGRRQQTLQPTPLTDLFEKGLEALLWKRMPVD